MGNFKGLKKLGRWEVLIQGQKGYKERQNLRNTILISGGGFYDNSGGEIKIGEWIEYMYESGNGQPKNKLLRYQGEYRNGKKFGRWECTCEGTNAKGGGFYDQNGDKIGKWKEIISDKEIIFYGEYYQGKRVGQWKIISQADHEQENKEFIIGGGTYDQTGRKTGKWTLCNSFKSIQKQENMKMTYKLVFGLLFIHYIKMKPISILFVAWVIMIKDQKMVNGQNQVIWTLVHIEQVIRVFIKKVVRLDLEQFSLIGGGSYDTKGEGVKSGVWIELIKKDYNDDILYFGQYQKDKKVGKWRLFIYSKQNHEDDIYKDVVQFTTGFSNDHQQIGHDNDANRGLVQNFEQQRITLMLKFIHNLFSGGGSYDTECEGLKTGGWFELIDVDSKNGEILYYGQYQKDKKVGKWQFFQYGSWCRNNAPFRNLLQFITGLTDDRQDIGQDNYAYESGVQDLKKLIMLPFIHKLFSGGGSYDSDGSGMKIGQWIERKDECHIYCGEYKDNKKIGLWKELNQQKRIKSCMNYDDEGNEIYRSGFPQKILRIGEFKGKKKIGRWSILTTETSANQDEIGGGSYDSDGSGMKIGKWIELKDEYNIYCGEYKDNKKIGLWKELNQQKRIKSCMNYDDEGNEIYRSGFPQKILRIGEFRGDKKVGRWEILLQKQISKCDSSIISGGGTYDEEGYGMKIGRWIDFSDGITTFIVEDGEYKANKKVGLWKKYLLTSEDADEQMLVGCSNYDDQGIEIYKSQMPSKLIFIGEVRCCKKVGEWKILRWVEDFNTKKKSYIQIGGGYYNEGIKIGKWEEVINYTQNIDWLLRLAGEYSNGKKVGRWDIFRFKNFLEVVFMMMMELKLETGSSTLILIIFFKVDMKKEKNLVDGTFSITIMIQLQVDYIMEVWILSRANGLKQKIMKEEASSIVESINQGRKLEDGILLGAWIQINQLLQEEENILME
ncbi:unnamed protein product (macronuclear) [Paramecium tetraurelia]|uniref:MORN repeat protein n=1 Tax=Paramecium tetraurelia TaxID=5888 RepID=A0CJ86_PARTE|nr:uncharacterized protein GSPATT00038635001 [Paramecium tetraurelia]CAK70853.1 unnamed protein product [Paramecium tetraurelia]|eukprot:XP_001438250.1 hypothetical protein (macronuclear) [Paramecium tetraurelia strain d4-2]